jgi:hypothetical protein
MRCVPALLSVALLLVATPASGASTSAPRLNELTSRDAVLGWVWAYRSK